MGLPYRVSRYLGRTAMLGSTGLLLAGCVADFLGPVSVASHRYPSVRQAVSTPAVAKVQLVDEEPVRADRLPTAREIFDLHPKGSDPEHMRQPFLLNPHEGPLKISTLSKDDAATADAVRLGQSDASARMANLRPVPLAPMPLAPMPLAPIPLASATPANPVVRPPLVSGHQ